MTVFTTKDKNGFRLRATILAGALLFCLSVGHGYSDGTVADTSPKTVSVTFEIQKCNTVFGQNVYVLGNIPQLGNWQSARAFPLTIQGSGANVPWKGTISLPAGTPIQYKYVLWDGTSIKWEASQKTTSGNREVTTPASGDVVYNDGDFANVTPAPAK